MYITKINYPAHKKKYGLSTLEDSLIILFEGNATYITQVRGGYIKGDKTKHISPKFFFIITSFNKMENLISSKLG